MLAVSAPIPLVSSDSHTRAPQPSASPQRPVHARSRTPRRLRLVNESGRRGKVTRVKVPHDPTLDTSSQHRGRIEGNQRAMASRSSRSESSTVAATDNRTRLQPSSLAGGRPQSRLHEPDRSANDQPQPNPRGDRCLIFSITCHLRYDRPQHRRTAASRREQRLRVASHPRLFS